VRDASTWVKLLEDTGWDGMRHFDSHAYRTEDADGVWEFAAASMRTYLILREKARRFHADPTSPPPWKRPRWPGCAEPTTPEGGLRAIRAADYDLAALGAQGYGMERLDALVDELLLGVR